LELCAFLIRLCLILLQFLLSLSFRVELDIEFFDLIQSLSKGKKGQSVGMLKRLSEMYFASADKDSSGDLNFDEFLELYSRLEKL